MSETIVVLDGYTLNPGDLSWDGLEKLGQVTVYNRTEADEIVSRAQGAPYVLTNKTPLDKATLEQLPNLRYIGVLATGYNVVDVAAAKARNIPVTNIPTYGTNSVAQHATGLMLEMSRQIGMHDQAVHRGEWANGKEWCFALAPVVELTHKVLGIVGLGRIGLALARIGAAMGMKIIAHDNYQLEAEQLDGLEVEYKSLDEVFAEADVLSLHCPLTDHSHHMVNAQRLALMKSSAFLINTSRGPLVDNQALADALTNKTIAAAALDVLDQEPPPADNPLLSAPRCVITPHLAWYAQAARQRLLDTAVANLKAFADGQAQNVVNP
jgi:glycerate dehydrogenase